MQNNVESDNAPGRVFFEAIACKRVVVATYNGNEVRLAPHQLFSRHGDMFLTALNLSKNWRSEDEWRLGQFKLQGLSNVTLSDETFEPLDDYDGSVPREGDEQLFTI